VAENEVVGGSDALFLVVYDLLSGELAGAVPLCDCCHVDDSKLDNLAVARDALDSMKIANATAAAVAMREFSSFQSIIAYGEGG
jgi:hypothetical protein